jgi:hypothetical protein
MNTYIGEVLQQLHDTSDAEAIHMMHAVKTIRNETLTSKFAFDGQLSLAKCEAPPMFHALTGCDTVFFVACSSRPLCLTLTSGLCNVVFVIFFAFLSACLPT